MDHDQEGKKSTHRRIYKRQVNALGQQGESGGGEGKKQKRGEKQSNCSKAQVGLEGRVKSWGKTERGGLFNKTARAGGGEANLRRFGRVQKIPIIN